MSSRKPVLIARTSGSPACPAPTRSAGFSMIETMMSLILLAVGMALAVPSYREMVEKRQITYGAEQLMSFVNSAQSEAIKQNQVLTVAYAFSSEDDWCVGAVLGAAACDCTQTSSSAPDYCAIDSSPWIIDNSHAGNRNLVHTMEGDGAYSFDPVRGLLTDLADELVVEMRSDSGDYRLQLMVSATGQVILCSGDSSHAVPGYPACPAQEQS